MSEREWPKDGDQYFHIDQYGCVLAASWVDWLDRKYIAIGNCFPSRALAERHVRAMKTLAELRGMAGRKKFEILKLNNWYIDASVFDLDGPITFDVCETVLGHSDNIFGVFFDSEESARNALNIIGRDRLNEWLDDHMHVPMEGK